MDLDEVLAATFSLVAPHLIERQLGLLLGAAPMGGVLDTVRWEADQLTETIGAPVIPMLTLGRLVATLRVLPPHMDQTGVMLLAEHARHQLHPAT